VCGLCDSVEAVCQGSVPAQYCGCRIGHPDEVQLITHIRVKCGADELACKPDSARPNRRPLWTLLPQ